MTNRENHEHQSTYHYSLTIKRFALLVIIVYPGLELFGFGYASFGHQLMAYLHPKLNTQTKLSEQVTGGAAGSFDITANQMYAYTVMFGLPYVVRFLRRLQGVAGWNRKASATGGEERKEEQRLLVRIRKEVALGLGGECDVFERHLEMTTQFTYVVCWSTIWPLAPGASFQVAPSLFPDIPLSHSIDQQLRRTPLRRIHGF